MLVLPRSGEVAERDLTVAIRPLGEFRLAFSRTLIAVCRRRLHPRHNRVRRSVARKALRLGSIPYYAASRRRPPPELFPSCLQPRARPPDQGSRFPAGVVGEWELSQGVLRESAPANDCARRPRLGADDADRRRAD